MPISPEPSSHQHDEGGADLGDVSLALLRYFI